MATFKFRLEQVLLYRKQIEEQAMQVHAAAVMRRDETIVLIENIKNGLLEQRDKMCRADLLSAADLWLARTYETALREDLVRATMLLAQQEAEVDETRQVLIKKSQERKLLDRLKDKQFNRYNQHERQQEQKSNDETATLRYKPAAF